MPYLLLVSIIKQAHSGRRVHWHLGVVVKLKRLHHRLHGVHADSTLFYTREILRGFGTSSTTKWCQALSPHPARTSKQIPFRARGRHVSWGTTVGVRNEKLLKNPRAFAE